MKKLRKVATMIMGVSIAATMLTGCFSINVKKAGPTVVEDLEKTTVDSFSNINLDVDVAAVQIIPEGDAYAVEYHIIDQHVDYSIEDGELMLKAEGDNVVTINSTEHSYIKIYVPEGSGFTRIDYEGDVGDFRAERIKVDDMTINTDVGNVELSGIKVNKNLDIETAVGNVAVNLANADCSYNISADVAAIVINGAEYSGVEVTKEYTSERGPKVTIRTDTGKISFDCKSASN